MKARTPITRISADERNDIREAVLDAVEFWPNAHLGECSPREDIHSAFRMIRSHAIHNGNLRSGISALWSDAQRHIDM